jgi:hypothetical protein
MEGALSKTGSIGCPCEDLIIQYSLVVSIAYDQIDYRLKRAHVIRPVGAKVVPSTINS